MAESALVEDCRRALARVVRPLRRGGAVACDEVAAELPAILEGSSTASSAVVTHVEYCLSCQAELARYRKLLRLMHQLRLSDVVVPPSIVADVLATLEGAAGRRAIRSLLNGRRVAYGTAVVAAVTAGTVLVLFARTRTGTSTEPAADGVR